MVELMLWEQFIKSLIVAECLYLLWLVVKLALLSLAWALLDVRSDWALQLATVARGLP